MVNISRPNAEIVRSYIFQWANLAEHYKWQESSLNKLFHETYKYNNDLNEIMIKVSCINDFYSTNIFSIYPVAKNIYDLHIDERLKDGDETLVDDIAKVTIGGKKRNFYSFASKYCSHHCNSNFPIYDYYVERVLLYFLKKDKFFDFKALDLKKYHNFKTILIAFQNYYGLTSFSLRDIDKYLWLSGKEYFPKKYK